MTNSDRSDTDFKILIAEDDFLVSEMIEGELLDAGYTVAGKAADGLRAVELTKALAPDIVLMDIRMPEVSGLEAAKKIMTCCPTPVIILTAYDSIDFVREAGKAGVGAFLNKPLDPKELKRAILIATARFKDIKQLKEADILNKALMKEIHHRVKNSFQLISSLLSLQIDSIKNINAKRIIEASRNRVQTLAVLHEKLYTIGDLETLPISDFIKDLLDALIGVYSINSLPIVLKADINNIILDADKAATIGLIINEAVTNSLKYAFPKDRLEENRIEVTMKEKSEMITLRIADNGIGMEKTNGSGDKETLGLNLIRLLTESQLEET